MRNYKKIMKNLGKTLYWLFFAGLILVASLVALSSSNILPSYKLLVVQSGSMQPSIPMGSMVLIKESNDYRVGDVITFQNTGDTKYLITHRLKDIQELENGKLYITKGDANEDADSERIDAGSVVGKVVWALPLLGFVVSFARTQTGLIALVVIPATIIIYSEILAIKKELGKLRDNVKRKPKASRFFMPKLLLLLLLLGLSTVGQSKSAYTDSETVNSDFAAAECFDGCGGAELLQSQAQEPDINLTFSQRPGLLEVGFEITGVSGYDRLQYDVQYDRDAGHELIPGDIDNLTHSNSITEKWIILGFCTTGGTCFYDQGVTNVDLNVYLYQGVEIVKTLHRSLSI